MCSFPFENNFSKHIIRRMVNRNTNIYHDIRHPRKGKKEEIRLSTTIESLTPTEKIKKQRSYNKKATKMFDYTAVGVTTATKLV